MQRTQASPSLSSKTHRGTFVINDSLSAKGHIIGMYFCFVGVAPADLADNKLRMPHHGASIIQPVKHEAPKSCFHLAVHPKP